MPVPRSYPGQGSAGCQSGHLLLGDEQCRFRDRRRQSGRRRRPLPDRPACLSEQHGISTWARLLPASIRPATSSRTPFPRRPLWHRHRKTSPAWQFTLLDSTFDGQRDAAIREHEAQLTLVNVAIRDTPIGIDIDRGYGDWLWGKDVRFENVAAPRLSSRNENNVYTQIGFENALASDTPVFARFRDSGRTSRARARPIRSHRSATG